ncbi:MAG: hypothetical protein LBP53_06000 [Candidatus Peribacteria bacterium]|jgi:hypothetical protein|nr:hypothetical protein [Candidatus Peribacteria bacterium]
MAGKPTNSIQVSYTSLPDGMIPINSKPIIGNEQSISPLLNCFDNFIENLGTDELARYKKPLYIIINLATILSSRTLKNKKIRRFT